MDTVETRALQSIPFLAGLSPEDLQNVLQIGQTVSFQPGDVIVEQGQPGDGMYILVQGSAEVDVGGRYHTLKEGDFFGEMALIADKKRMATVKAVDPVEALKLGAEDFQSFLIQHPTVTVAILKALVERLREVEQRIDAWMGTG